MRPTGTSSDAPGPITKPPLCPLARPFINKAVTMILHRESFLRPLSSQVEVGNITHDAATGAAGLVRQQ